MKFLELRQKDVINCNTGECLGLVLDLEFEIHTGKICYLIVPKTTKMFINKSVDFFCPFPQL